MTPDSLGFKAAIFDLDGTLTDTEPLHAKAWMQALQQLNIKTGANFPSVYGRRDADILREFLDQSGHSKYEGDPTRLLELKSEHYARLVEKHLKTTPCAEELTKKLKEAGLKLAVVTSSRRRDALLVLEKLKVNFDLIITGEDVQRAKPDPESIKLALRQLNLSPEEAIAFGDSEYDAEAYKAAGIKKIYIVKGDIPNRIELNEVTYVRDLCVASRLLGL